MAEEPNRLVWLDLEVTGPDPGASAIREIATVVTDSNLEIVAQGPNLAIREVDDLRAAALETSRFIEGLCAKGTAPLCGDAVYRDKEVLERHMPEVLELLHYRVIDVATVREIVRRWYPPSFHAPARAPAGLLGDLLGSIEELRFYRATVLVPTAPA